MIRRIARWYNTRRYWQKLLITYLAVTLVPIVAIGAFTYYFSGNVLKTQLVQGTMDSSSKMSYIISNKILFYENTIEELIYDDELLQICSENSTEYLTSFQVDNYFDQIENQIEITNDEVLNISIYSKYIQVSHRDFLKPLNQIFDEGLLYLAENDRETVWVSQEGRLFAARSIYDPYTLKYLGIISIEFDHSQFFKEYTTMDLNQYGLVIVDLEGNEIYSKEKINEGLGKIPPNYLMNIKSDVFVYNSSKYILSVIITPRQDWKIYIYIPYTLISAKVSRIITLTIATMAGCFVLMILLSLYMSRKIGKRINILAGAMVKASTGELNFDIPDGPPDEIGQLTSYFKDMMQKIDNLIIDIYKSRLIQRDAEFKALQAQINPHFLYNSLNIINWRGIIINDEKITRMATNLSDFYRTTLNKGKSQISIADEIINIKAYIDIQLEMHNNNVDIEYDIDEDVYSFQTMNLLLQPLVENAFEHGIDKYPDRRGYLKLAVKHMDDTVRFEVTNSGDAIVRELAQQAITKETKGYGLSNVNDRIKLAYGEQYGISLEPLEDGTRAIIIIPAIRWENGE